MNVVTQHSYIIHRRHPKPVSSYAQSQDLPLDVHVSREQAERIRMILPLHGAPVPQDIVLFSRRGPITISEISISLAPHNPS